MDFDRTEPEPTCCSTIFLTLFLANKMQLYIIHSATLYIHPRHNSQIEQKFSYWYTSKIKWASMGENLSLGVCEQQRRRPACASTQTDQRLCYSLFEKCHISTCYKRNFNFLASLCSWGDWFESHFVRNSKAGFVATRHKLNISISFPSQQDNFQH